MKVLALAQMAELDREMAELAGMKAALEDIVSGCPGDHTTDCPILSKLAGSAAPTALPSPPAQRRPTIGAPSSGRALGGRASMLRFRRR